MPTLCQNLTTATIREVIHAASLLNARHGQGSRVGITDLWAFLDALPALQAAGLPLRRALERLNVSQRIELKAIVYVGRGDCESFEEAKLLASEDTDRASDIDHLSDMAPLAIYVRAGVEKLGIDLTQEHLASIDV